MWTDVRMKLKKISEDQNPRSHNYRYTIAMRDVLKMMDEIELEARRTKDGDPT